MVPCKLDVSKSVFYRIRYVGNTYINILSLFQPKRSRVRDFGTTFSHYTGSRGLREMNVGYVFYCIKRYRSKIISFLDRSKAKGHISSMGRYRHAAKTIQATLI